MSRFTAAAVSMLVTAGCSSAPSALCVAGRVESCPCVGGGSGVQTCLADGTFGSCSCSGAPDGGSADAGAPDAGSLDAGPPDAGPPDAGPVDAGPHGHLVMLGLAVPEYVPDTSIDKVFRNAVFLSERPGDPHVLEYYEFSTEDAGVPTRMHQQLAIEASNQGRAIFFNRLATSADLATALPSADVLVVYPQRTLLETQKMLTIAAAWHDPLVSFLNGGGVIVVLTAFSHYEQSSGLVGPGDEYRLVNGAGLFDFSNSARYPSTAGLMTEIVATQDPLLAGVTTFSTGSANCYPSSTGGTVVIRSVAGSTALPALCPVVRHLVR